METFLTGACLRNEGSGWQCMTNGGHAPLNITDVITTNYYIEVQQVGGDINVTAIVTVDNDLAAQGYTVGLTGGRDIARLILYKNGAVVNPNTINTSTVPNSNLWYLTVQGVTS